MNQHPNLTPRDEANCRRYHNLSYAHELAEKMEPKLKVSRLPPIVGASSSSWWAAPWGFGTKARANACLYRPTYPWQLCSDPVNGLLHSPQRWNLSRAWRIHLEWIQGWSTTLDGSLSLLVRVFPICCFLPWLFALVARAVASLPHPQQSNRRISVCRLLDASPSHGCFQLVLLLQRKGDNIMNKAILWNVVLIKIFAAVVTIGLRQQTFVRKRLS